MNALMADQRAENAGLKPPWLSKLPLWTAFEMLAALLACTGGTPAPDPTETPAPGAIAAPPALIPNTPAPVAATSTPMHTAPRETPAPPTAPAPTQQSAQSPGQWRGLVIAPENRCSPYDSGDYPYPQSVEARIVNVQGGVRPG